MAAAETIGLGRTGGGVGLVFPKFVLAPSGIIPDPPFSISQGSVPEGQGYSSSERFVTIEILDPPSHHVPQHTSIIPTVLD